MWHLVKDLSDDQRFAIESLLGRQLAEDEGVNIQPSRLLKDAPAGANRAAAYAEYLRDLNRLAIKAEGISDAELDAILDEACEQARHDRK